MWLVYDCACVLYAYVYKNIVQYKMRDGVFISVFVQLVVSSRCGVVDHVLYSWSWPPCGYAMTQSCTSDTNFWWTLALLLLPNRHGVVAAKHALPRQSCSDLHSGPLSCAPLFCMQVNDPTVQYMSCSEGAQRERVPKTVHTPIGTTPHLTTVPGSKQW